MSTDPSQIRAQIEDTRASLSDDVDALAYQAHPAHLAQRQVEKVKAKGARLLDRILGSAEDLTDDVRAGVHDASRAVAGTASDVGDAVADAPRNLRRQAEGNPVVAGLVAFGLGLLVAAAIPPTRKERELAEELKERAQPLVDQVSAAAHEVADNLAEPASEAVDSLKQSAGEAVRAVQAEGEAAVEDVTGTARDAAGEVSAEASHAAGQVKDSASDAATRQGRESPSLG